MYECIYLYNIEINKRNVNDVNLILSLPLFTEPIDNNAIQHNNANTVDYVNYDYPQPSKRGRGYAPTGEFDLSLIREFRARPGFYDRNSASFKDKLHTAHQWQEISNKLGFDGE